MRQLLIVHPARSWRVDLSLQHPPEAFPHDQCETHSKGTHNAKQSVPRNAMNPSTMGNGPAHSLDKLRDFVFPHTVAPGQDEQERFNLIFCIVDAFSFFWRRVHNITYVLCMQFRSLVPDPVHEVFVADHATTAARSGSIHTAGGGGGAGGSRMIRIHSTGPVLAHVQVRAVSRQRGHAVQPHAAPGAGLGAVDRPAWLGVAA